MSDFEKDIMECSGDCSCCGSDCGEDGDWPRYCYPDLR